jgi:hypothetical protein
MSPVVACGLAGAVLTLAGCARGGLRFIAVVFGGALPWLVVFNDVVPRLTATFAAAAATAAVFLLVDGPVRRSNLLVFSGASLLLSSVAVNAVQHPGTLGLIQAGKYLIFPALVVAVCKPAAFDSLRSLRRPFLASLLAAMCVHLAVSFTTLGATGSYYGAGERLGLAAGSPHQLALIAVSGGVAGFLAANRWRVRVLCLLLGTVPALLTGVRAALLAIAVVLIMLILGSRLSLMRKVVLVALVAALGTTGAFTAFKERVAKSTQDSEFASVATAGSGRGGLWETAVGAYLDAGPAEWAFGTGLRSLIRLEQERGGVAAVGHSDVIEVGVQLGAVGLLGWLLLWIGLLRTKCDPLILVPLLIYALVGGAMELTPAVTLVLVLALVCRGTPPARAAASSPEPHEVPASAHVPAAARAPA